MHGMQEVTGSIPVISTRKKSTAQECAVLFCCVCPAMQLLNSCWTFAESYGIILSAIAGIVHRLVYQPSKLRTWVRLPSAAPKKIPVSHPDTGIFLLQNAAGANSIRPPGRFPITASPIPPSDSSVPSPGGPCPCCSPGRPAGGLRRRGPRRRDSRCSSRLCS